MVHKCADTDRTGCSGPRIVTDTDVCGCFGSADGLGNRWLRCLWVADRYSKISRIYWANSEVTDVIPVHLDSSRGHKPLNMRFSVCDFGIPQSICISHKTSAFVDVADVPVPGRLQIQMFADVLGPQMTGDTDDSRYLWLADSTQYIAQN